MVLHTNRLRWVFVIFAVLGALVLPVRPSFAAIGWGGIVSIDPVRLVNTRSSDAVAVNGGLLEVPAAGVGAVPATATAVVLTVTATGATSGGFLTTHPGLTSAPATSIVNFAANQTVANSTIAKVGIDQKVRITAGGGFGTVDVLVDVCGYIEGAAPLTPGGYMPLQSARLLDTRTGVGAPAGAVPAGASIPLMVAGVGDVPPDASAVALNVTAVNPTAAGFLQVGPSPGPIPGVSNLNYGAGATVPNQVIVKMGADGKILFRPGGGGTVHILADIAGYFVVGTPEEFGALSAIDPRRALDTRKGSGAVAGGSSTVVDLEPTLTAAGIDPANVGAVVVNLTAVDPAAAGFLTAYASGTPRPPTSNLNYAAKETRAISAIVQVGADASIEIYVGGGTSPVHLIVDVAGVIKGSAAGPPPGTVYAWGNNDSGELCIGEEENRLTPHLVDVPPVSSSVGLRGTPTTAGQDFGATFLLMDDGTVQACGNSATVSSPDEWIYSPRAIPGLNDVTGVQGSGWDAAFALTPDGTVYSWGGDPTLPVPALGRTGSGTEAAPITSIGTVTQLLPAVDAVYALDSTGTVWSWGRGIWGELGQGPDTTTNATPTALTDNTGQPLPPITELFTSSTTTFALTETGQLYSWGYNIEGQAGVGTNTHVFTPTLIADLPAIQEVIPASDTTYAITTTGEVYAWGTNDQGQLALGNTTSRNTPIEVPALSGISELWAASATAYATLPDGTLLAWGANNRGQLGNDTTAAATTPQPILTDIERVITDGNTTFAITTDHRLYGWGWNHQGQVGNGTTTNVTTPYLVPHVSAERVIQGVDFTLVLTTTGTVYTMGANYWGEAGNSNLGNQTTPFPVPLVRNITHLTYSYGAVIAITG